MRSLLLGELAFCAALVIGSMATLDRPLTSLRAWVIAFGSLMLLWFLGTQALVANPYWVTFLVVAMGFKIVGLVLLLQNRVTQWRRVKLEAIADASKRNLVLTLSRVRGGVDGGWVTRHRAEPAQEAEATARVVFDQRER